MAGKVLPPVEIHVGFQVGLPRILDGRFERHHEDALGPELLGKLIFCTRFEGGALVAANFGKIKKTSKN